MKNKKGRRSRNKATCNEDAACKANGDRLSRLPNDLLLNILERVETFDALRACILSKQMLKLPAMFSQIVIDVGSLVPDPDSSHKFGIRDVARVNGAVAKVTDNILWMRSPGITIRKLNVRMVLRHYDVLSVGKSFAHAMATRKVQKAEIEFMTEKACADCTPADLVDFAKCFNTILADCLDAFAGFTRLWLQNMRFGEGDIPNVLTTCKRLQSLRLSYCDSGIRSVLCLEHAQLIDLEINYGKFEKVVLNWLPKLQQVTYNNWCSYDDEPLAFGFVPQLSKLSLAKIAVRSDSLHSILDMLLLSQISVLPECPKLLTPVLGKLRLVNLENLPEGCDIAWTMFILETAPVLKELCITVWDHWCIMVTDKEHRKASGYCDNGNVEWKPSVSSFKHKNLAKLTIYGSKADDNFIQYVRRVMVAAVNMEEISLHDRMVWKCCSDSDPKTRYPRTDEERQHVIEELGMDLHAVVHFRS
ncbi:hypothetical protein TRIUR3_29292 [Triticum urartu]|uniref:Uncharacterized protein n=1 Tax=Triticum urartu TaxID=4572 RepID=M7ZSV1_TRIUA|nr:hypothetical protein TRIUR3_29292 [Triticum urartu]